MRSHPEDPYAERQQTERMVAVRILRDNMHIHSGNIIADVYIKAKLSINCHLSKIYYICIIVRKLLFSIILLLVCAISPAQWDKDVFMMRGRQALSDGKYSQAIENFTILSRLDTADYWSFFFRGIAKYNLGDIIGAEKDFNKSVTLNPVFTNGYHYRAISESRQGNYDRALADLKTAIELRPGFPGLYFSRGVTFFLAQRFEEAVKDFNKYIRNEPEDPSAYLNRGASYLFLGDTLKALDDYNKAIKLDRFEPEGYIRRGRVFAEMGDDTSAIADMNRAIELDTTNTFAYFNRALMHYENKDYNAAMNDLNHVLRDEPGNALTLYNRSLIYAQVGSFNEAVEDMDRVININPGNVLAYFNRAAIFTEMGRWKDALADYNKAIDLYPDFAKAYLNRSYVQLQLGHTKASKADYNTAQQKVREYNEKTSGGVADFSDTTRKYNSLLSLDADFAKKDFDDELLQHRDVDVKLRPMYRFSLSPAVEERGMVLAHRFENAVLDRFMETASRPVTLSGTASSGDVSFMEVNTARDCFLKGLQEVQKKQFAVALTWFDQAVSMADTDAQKDKYARYYKAFYLMNRGVLKAEMIDFIASLEGNVQTLSMDTDGAARTTVNDKASRCYDYSEAIADVRQAIDVLPDIAHLYFNLGNLHCLNSQLVESISDYDRAIGLYPYLGDAYFNRGLVLIYLKDREKACIDLSRAGELGVDDAYAIINKYCKLEE